MTIISNTQPQKVDESISKKNPTKSNFYKDLGFTAHTYKQQAIQVSTCFTNSLHQQKASQ